MAHEACMESFIKYKIGLDNIERSGLEDVTEETYEKLFTVHNSLQVFFSILFMGLGATVLRL